MLDIPQYERNSAVKEFFGIDGFSRAPEGFMSWQHLVFVTSLVVVMIALAVVLGIKNRGKDLKAKNKIIIYSAIFIDAVEIFKIIIFYIRSDGSFDWGNVLPLFLCSIQLFTIPLAAFSNGRLKEAALDFVFIFGLLGALLGTYGAGQNYDCYPVLSIDNVASGITHCISGFASLYIVISGMASMKRRNMHITFGIIGVVSVLAYTAGALLDKNYMFLFRGDGTPYDIVFNFVGKSPVLYPIAVILLFVIYMALFYFCYYLGASKSRRALKSNAARL